MRVNPEHSEVKVASTILALHFRGWASRGRISGGTILKDLGLHFHTLCELNAIPWRERSRPSRINSGEFMPRMRWVNFGGGHHITRPDYDADLLCELIADFKKRHPVEVYLEPGEAVVLNAGVLVASVLDLLHNQRDLAILDASAAAHAPDVLEMPYRPESKVPEARRVCLQLSPGRLDLLAGDVFGDYSFPEPLRVGSRLIFTDMAHYTMVKNNTFNGVGLPSIAIRDASGQIRHRASVRLQRLSQSTLMNVIRGWHPGGRKTRLEFMLLLSTQHPGLSTVFQATEEPSIAGSMSTDVANAARRVKSSLSGFPKRYPPRVGIAGAQRWIAFPRGWRVRLSEETRMERLADPSRLGGLMKMIPRA